MRSWARRKGGKGEWENGGKEERKAALFGKVLSPIHNSPFLSSSRPLFLSVLLVFLLQAGCLPSSQKHSTRAITATDSLSRQIAAEVPVDTLHLVWQLEAPASTPFELPTSLTWLPHRTPDTIRSQLVVADTRRHSLHVVSSDGAYRQEWRPQGLQFPYIAGTRGDTLAVLNRGAGALSFLVEGAVVRQLTLPGDAASAALVTDSEIWVKETHEQGSFVSRLDTQGREQQRYGLSGPAWRHTGFLRQWGDTLLSLSGYRPVIDQLPLGASSTHTPDSLMLLGFDSPQLVRSYQFLLGEVDEPPLLTSSAAALGNRLYVLNLRPDRLRIDMYDKAGRLRRVLLLPDAVLMANVFPVDLAVRQDSEGSLLFALVLQQPGGLLHSSSGRLALARLDP